MMTLDFSDISQDDAERVVEKLLWLRETLAPPEQSFLDQIVQYIKVSASREPKAMDLVEEVPDSPELLDDVAGFMMQDETVVAMGTAGNAPSWYYSLWTNIMPWDCPQC